MRISDWSSDVCSSDLLEMDLRMEGAAASELAENFADDTTYNVPAIAWRRSSRRVLTMSRVYGIPMDDRAALLAAGHALADVLNQAAAIGRASGRERVCQ